MFINKKIVLFTFQFPYGDQETFLENEVAYLSKTFQEVKIVPLFSDNSVREIKYENIGVLESVFKSLKSSTLCVLHFKFWYYLCLGLLDIGFSSRKIKKIFKQAIIITGIKKYLKRRSELQKSDIWYFYWGTNSVNVLPFIKKHPKSIARFHRYDLYDEDIDGGDIQVFRTQMLEKLTSCFMITQDAVKYLSSKFPKVKTKLHLSRLGVPDRGISSASNDEVFRIVTCSNIYKVKRVILIAQSLCAIKEINVQWTHFGDGPKDLRENLMEEIAKLPKNVDFHFKGRCSNQAVMQFFNENPIDLFLNVSLSEGFPVSIMEALSFGVPVMATNCGGVGELIDSSNGKLLDLHLTINDLKNELCLFYKDHFGNNELRLNARATWEKSLNADTNYLAFYKKLSRL